MFLPFLFFYFRVLLPVFGKKKKKVGKGILFLFVVGMGNRNNHSIGHYHHHSLEGAPPLQRTFYRWMTINHGGPDAEEVLARLTDAERAMVRAYLGTVRRRPESVAVLAGGIRASVLRYTRPLDAAGDLEDTLAAPLARALMAAAYGCAPPTTAPHNVVGRRRRAAVDHASYEEYVRSDRPLTDAERAVLAGCLHAVVDRWFVGVAVAADADRTNEDGGDTTGGMTTAPPDVWRALHRVQLRFHGDQGAEAAADSTNGRRTTDDDDTDNDTVVVHLPLADLSPMAANPSAGVRCLEILTDTVVRLGGGSHTH